MSPSEELERLSEALIQRASKLKSTVDRMNKKLVIIDGYS